MTKNNYLKKVEQQIKWHDQKAIRFKKKYMQGKIVATIASSMIPLLAVISSTFQGTKDIVILLTALLGMITSICAAYANETQYNRLYVTYRLTCKQLAREKCYFENHIGPYSFENDKENLEQFVLRCEDILDRVYEEWSQISQDSQKR